MSRIFTLSITMDNAAFDEDNGSEVARILRDIGYRFDATMLAKEHQPVLDINGNTVGRWAVEEDDEVQEHIESICKDAGLGVMVQVYEIVRDREQVEESALMALTADDVTTSYEGWIAPAIDDVEDSLLAEG